jgi:acyl-coenzyme A thioesterase PaaI-like protein
VSDEQPPSALEWARARAGTLPRADDVLTPAALALVARARDLVDAVVQTGVGDAERAALADELAALVERLRATARTDPVVVVRHGTGRIENATQAGSGRLNPQAPAIDLDPVPAPPPAGARPVPVEVTARTTLTARHGGPPGRAHGGVVAALLDEVLGIAAYVAGASGMTGGLDVRFRRATPVGVPLTVTARWVGRDGRRSRATGEIRAPDGRVTAEATAVFVSVGS